MNYSPKTYSGEHFAEIFSEVLQGNNTVDKNLVRVLDNIKNERVVTTIGGKASIQPYMVTPTAFTDSITFGDAIIKPVKQMSILKFTPEDLRFSRFASDMKSGAANIESNEFLAKVLDKVAEDVGEEMEELFWAGVVSKLNAASGVIKLSAATLTASNLKTEFDKIYSAIPDPIVRKKETKIFADHSVGKLIRQANVNATYRDIFGVTGDECNYLGVKIEFVPLGANKITVGKATDYIWGTDLLADYGTIQVDRMAAYSDEWFVKTVFSLDSAVCVPSQKVLYA